MSEDEHAAKNRVVWDERYSGWFGGRAAEQWAAEPHWGIWATPESELNVLPDLADKDVIDLGCGTAYIGAWVLRAGGRPVGIDNSAEQLATAAALQQEFGLVFPLIHGNAEDVPLPDATFDVAISEYGASSWCDPAVWIPEAARLLRAGGQLIFLRNSTLLELCTAPGAGTATDRLSRPYADVARIARTDGGTHFQLPTGQMIKVLRDSGFVVDELTEVVVPADARSDYEYVTPEWASVWPSVEVWKATRS
ncbi:class I SAM-dependent methyltransferase [Kribbella sp. VKM Ac-2566]|uniref:class I SAM-dependent methyltransferase n=1 Tax=Kribbella sp. VKM Ac-2566 TaxID=2512218 RepID=UPI0010645AF2|nr:class I SAM-dependent methyltransferase [Kribbella sp. VKM Ac-2566]TDW86776.1 methyltransferase family protein [Kribbella sp. VKM Ac-2566]